MSEQTLFPTSEQPDALAVAPAPATEDAPAAAVPAPSSRVPLRELEDGQRVAGVYAVRQRELRRKRNGEPWLRLSVGDATGAAEAVCWEEAESRYALCSSGSAVFVTGVFEQSERWGAKIKISELREAQPGEYDAEELAPESDVSLELLERDLRALLATIQDPD